jgi:hypothetical protein
MRQGPHNLRTLSGMPPSIAREIVKRRFLRLWFGRQGHAAQILSPSTFLCFPSTGDVEQRPDSVMSGEIAIFKQRAQHDAQRQHSFMRHRGSKPYADCGVHHLPETEQRRGRAGFLAEWESARAVPQTGQRLP